MDSRACSRGSLAWCGAPLILRLSAHRCPTSVQHGSWEALADIPLEMPPVAPQVQVPVRTVGALATRRALPTIRTAAVGPLEHIGAGATACHRAGLPSSSAPVRLQTIATTVALSASGLRVPVIGRKARAGRSAPQSVQARSGPAFSTGRVPANDVIHAECRGPSPPAQADLRRLHHPRVNYWPRSHARCAGYDPRAVGLCKRRLGLEPGPGHHPGQDAR